MVSGRKAAETESRGNFLHMGIANRNFERRFELADFVRVSDAGLEDGLLTIDLVREVPEAMKPKKITISSGTPKLSVVEGASQEDGDSKAA